MQKKKEEEENLLGNILTSGLITLHQAPVARNMIAPNGTETFYVSTPVPMELASHSCPVEELTASLSHALVGRFSCMLGKSAGSISNNEDIVSLLDQTESWEGNADFG